MSGEIWSGPKCINCGLGQTVEKYRCPITGEVRGRYYREGDTQKFLCQERCNHMQKAQVVYEYKKGVAENCERSARVEDFKCPWWGRKVEGEYGTVFAYYVFPVTTFFCRNIMCNNRKNDKSY